MTPRAGITAVFFVNGALQLTSLRLACGMLVLAGLIVMLLAPHAERRHESTAPAVQPSLST